MHGIIPRRGKLKQLDAAKILRAYDQFDRGEIQGVYVKRLDSGRVIIDRIPRILDDKTEPVKP